MTNDIVINNIINDLCQRFNVAASDLVPRLQAYGMAMSLYGAIAATIFSIVILVIGIFITKKWLEDEEIIGGILITILFDFIPVIVALCNIYSYIGWKYAPEVKSIEYIMQLFNK